MIRRWLVVLAAVTCLVAPSLNAQTSKIAVFVTPQTRDGFVDIDQGILDSIKDIQNEIRSSRTLTLSPSASDAIVVLTVVGRRVAGEAGAVGITSGGSTFGGGTVAGVKQPTYTTPGTTTMIPIDRRAIDTILRVGTYEKATTSEDRGQGAWRYAARQVVKDVSAWIEANRVALARPQEAR